MRTPVQRWRQWLMGVVVLECLAALAPGPAIVLAQDWQELTPRQRYDALRNYWQYERLPSDRQKDVDRGYERWRAMPEDERAKIRENYERLRQLPPEERERFERRYEKWRRQTTPQQ